MKRLLGIALAIAAMAAIAIVPSLALADHGRGGSDDALETQTTTTGTDDSRNDSARDRQEARIERHAAHRRAQTARREARRRCRTERKALGKDAFAAKYGEHALRACVKAALPDARSDVRKAQKDCRAERKELGTDAFRAKYGTNRNKRNAFGKCVSGKVHASAPATTAPTTTTAS